jgi:hypothetical protein
MYWHRMERKLQVTAVPTQVPEIARPGLAMDRAGWQVGASGASAQHEGRGAGNAAKTA